VLFQTQEFLALLLAVMIGLNLLRTARGQHWLLLSASYLFYGWWDVRFLMLILLSSVIDYVAALGIAGIRLSWTVRTRLSLAVIVAAAFFLGINWPALQSGTLEEGASLFGPQWEGAWAAIGASIAFALFGPLLYDLFFRLPESARRRAFLITSIVSNLGMLCFFKYFNFFSDNLSGIGGLLGFDWKPSLLTVALPVGISFYTFQTLSYTIDAYRGQIKPEHSFLRLALYVAYFPQLVAGPILRPQQFLPELAQRWEMRHDNLISGMNLAMVGLLKKVLIADSIAPFVDTLLGEPQGMPSIAIILGSAMFAIQIYCDFSGYTDIARGISRMFGVEIPLNFNFPYFSTSIIEFWRRWHISLSSWLRDYLYIPLGGSQCSTSRLYLNLMATMVLGGLWHGAAWNFVIWGAYQGVLLCMNRIMRGWIEHSLVLNRFCLSRIGTVLRWAITAWFWLLGWLIFRVTSLEDVWYCMKKFVFFDGRFDLASLGLGRGAPFIALLAAGVFCAVHAIGYFGTRWGDRLNRLPIVLLAAVYVLIGAVLFFAWPTTEQPFIYFQF